MIPIVIEDQTIMIPEEMFPLVQALTKINKTSTEIKALVQSDIIDAAKASIGNSVVGYAAGYAIARGQVTPTTGSDDVTTGLATVVAAFATLDSDPTTTHLFSTAKVAATAGHITLSHWKPTANDNVTPIAATTPWGKVSWLAIGTK